MTFRIPRLEDRPWIQKALHASNFRGCEYSFANNLSWYRAADSRIAQYKDFYIIAAFDTEDGVPVYTLPSGSGDYREILTQLAQEQIQRQQPLIISGITADQLDWWEGLFPDLFTKEWDRDGSDYLYLVEDFCNFSGKKFHQKRNHVKRFAEYGCTFSKMTEADFDDCITFAANSYNDKQGYTQRSATVEQFAIHTMLTHFHELELQGGVMRLDGKLVGFTIGEPINSDTFGVHIEKADTSLQGAFPALAQAFARNCAVGYTYLNREEDLGIAGLRKSKLSYHPVQILEKYIMTCQNPKRILG